MLYSRAVVMCHPDNAADRDNGTIVCRPELPHISARWTPAQVLRRDTLAGTFEHINPIDFSTGALWLQQALLYMPRENRRFSWSGATPVLALLLGALIALVAWGAT